MVCGVLHSAICRNRVGTNGKSPVAPEGAELKIRISLAWIATISLLTTSVGVTSAQAEVVTLKYEEFAADTNYKEMSAAMDSFFEEVRSKKVMALSNTVQLDMEGAIFGRSSLDAITSGSSFKYHSSNRSSSPDMYGVFKTTVMDYGFSGDSYYGTLATYAALNPKYTKSTLSRLGKPKATHFKSPRVTGSLKYLSPLDTTSIVFQSNVYMGTWNLVGMVTDNPLSRYSAVTKTPNALNPNDTDYTFDIKSPATMSFSGSNYIHTVVTISADGQDYVVKSDLEMPFFSRAVSGFIATTMTLNPPAIEVPDLKSALNLDSIENMSRKIELENSLTTIAKKAVTSAKASAAKAKKKLALTHIVTAVKKTKTKYVAIKGGIKLTMKLSKQSASVCINLVKNVAKIKVC